MSEVTDLSRAARETDVVIVGGGIAGLVAAYECARVGMPVTVLETTERLGGAVRSVTFDGVPVPTGAIAFESGGAVDKLIAALADDVATFTPERLAPQAQARTTNAHGGVQELPDGVLGIPGNPFDARAVAVIGWSGAWRAYLDRLRPPLTIGHQDNLDKLVRSRMGAKVADRLVAPAVRATFGLQPGEVDLAVAAPTLNPALTRLGSLTGAVSELLATTTNAWQTLDGTLTVLIAAIAQRITDLGGRILLDTTVTELATHGAQIRVTYTAARAAAEHDAEPDIDHETEPTTVMADVVFVATPEAPARALLAGLCKLPPAQDPEAAWTATITAHVTPAADSIQAGLSPQVSTSDAETIDNLTLSWGIQPADGDIVRMRIPIVDEYDTDTVLAQGVAEIERVLSVSVQEAHLDVFERAPHAEAAGFLQRTAPLRAKTARSGTIIPVGAWVSGTGLDRVVADTQDAVETVRRRVLFG